VRKLLGFALLLTCPAWAGYTYYLTDTLATIDGSKWIATGAPNASRTGLSASSAAGGTLVSRIPIPDGSTEGEVSMTLTLIGSGGTYTEFLQASADARTAQSGTGSYLAFEMQNPKFDKAGKCLANFVLLQSTGGTTKLVASFLHTCRNGMVMRMAVHGGTALVWPDLAAPMEFPIAATAAGQPGIGTTGTPAGNSIALVPRHRGVLGVPGWRVPGASCEHSVFGRDCSAGAGVRVFGVRCGPAWESFGGGDGERDGAENAGGRGEPSAAGSRASA